MIESLIYYSCTLKKMEAKRRLEKRLFERKVSLLYCFRPFKYKKINQRINDIIDRLVEEQKIRKIKEFKKLFLNNKGERNV